MAENGGDGKKVIGSVLVVGGGIAGIQAALDMAEAGFKVYLVEAKSAIGGHMAQLDKTFPTNDCAMCILSPKLVEAGHHRNIELLVDTEVVSVDGDMGNFTVRLRTKPRYVDLDKCTGCGECSQVCPIVLPDPFNAGLSQQRAVYKLYPQAVPNAYAIAKRGIPPCQDACPAGVHAQGYIALIRQRRYTEALELIKEHLPFPSVCGRTCHHPCEGKCTRRYVDEPVAIQALKRFVSDWVYRSQRPLPEPIPRTRKERIAIVGAGPAGLTAAQDLVKWGYGVTVFEALPEPGGMMRYGIPEHRLPKDVLRRDIADILALGVELRVNSPVEDPERLLKERFDAVYLAVGVYNEPRLGVEGENLEGVISAIQFLRDVNMGRVPDVGKRVAVVGGGITAVDAATTSLRLGADEVYLIYRRTRDELPAYGWELEEAEAEGVQLIQKAVVTRILGEKAVSAVEYAEGKPGPQGPNGRPTIEPVPGTERILPVDTVIRALGQSSDLWHMRASPGAWVGDPRTLTTRVPGIFAGPGQVPGAGFIVDAIAMGHRAALSIHRYLQGEPLDAPTQRPVPVVKRTPEEVKEEVAQGRISPRPRQPRSLLPVHERKERFVEFDLGFSERQAIAEAERCLDCGVCSECLRCVYACQANAINHDMTEQWLELEVGAILLAPGFETFDAEKAGEYGWGRYPNVVTSLQFERLLNASGPTLGHVQRPSDGRTPKRIAFIQCVGSRDQKHDYCSSVCCVYAIKEATMAIEHEPDTEVTIFLMDMRAFSKGYLDFYRRAQERYGIRFVRCRVSAVKEDPKSRNLVIRYVDEGNGRGIREEEFDLVVLSVGMEVPESVRDLARRVGVATDAYGFCQTVPFAPLQTSKPGVFAIGPFREPKDIPESVVEASAAAGLAGALLAPARWTETAPEVYPPERDVAGESLRIGVFVCKCGSNIAGFLDVPAVAEYAATLPGVVHAEHNLYTCSQDSIRRIIDRVQELNLNRVVVAACTPLTHEPLFQEAIRQAGLNPYLFEMANIRNQCSWVHQDDWDRATEKAKDLVRMAVAKAARLEPLHRTRVPVEKAALVIGGGAAGMNAALTLARQGFPVHLVERSDRLGGNLLHMHHSLQEATGDGERMWLDPQAYARALVERVMAEPRITVHLNTEVLETSGFVGQYVSRLRGAAGEWEVRHGVAIVAIGGVEYRGPDYGYGSDPRILTQQEFEQRLGKGTDLPNSVVMIQCVGPAERYCSRICCTTALKNALMLKRYKPQAQVTVIYRDIRTFGFKERIYQEARRAGVLFVRYDFDRKPQVQIADSRLQVRVWEPVLGEEWVLEPDLLVLSMPMVPSPGSREMAARLKLPVDLDGFFLEAHVKLRPVDFATDGFFLAGMAHYPKFLGEAIAQAQAAAARAATILSRDYLEVGGVVAWVDAEKCVGCLTCVRICPYRVPRIRADLVGVGGIVGAAYIEPAQCHGCGICVGECPAKAIQLLQYRDAQMEAKIEALEGVVAI
ncbi:MAG: FAD-dependent oxidoreductase [Anaerolineae bacterium]